MAISLFLLAAAATAAPDPIDAADWLRTADYPNAAMIKTQEGYVGYSLTVSPDGKAEHCEVTASSGFPLLDGKTCTVMMKRARFRPARDDASRPIASVYRGTSVWTVARTIGAMPPRPDVALEVEQLPAGAKSPARVTVDLIVDKAGAIESCQARPSGDLTGLGQIACGQTAALMRPAPARDSNGQPVRSLQSVVVEFTSPS